MDVLHYFYHTKTGRILLKPLISKPVSVLAGRLMDSRLSTVMIGPFARKHGISMQDYELDGVSSFNEFFFRKIKEGKRPVCTEKESLIAPCDGLLSISRIRSGRVIKAKQSQFTIGRLLKDRKLAADFEGGYCLVFRLCVQHYHRYIYFDSGYKHKNRRIEGFYHTVRPVALEGVPVFVENTRDYTVIDTESFGKCVQMEVGAMLVGRIVNKQLAPGSVLRGAEKGYFAYGGSTIIVLIPPGQVALRGDLQKNMDRKQEIPVRQGEKLGLASINQFH